jgi:receptor protein-tyrosine kinase
MTRAFDRIETQGIARVASIDERTIGGMLLDAGKITTADAERALGVQKEEGLRFGEACIKLGVVTRADIEEVLSRQFRYPYLRSGESNLGSELVAAYAPFSPKVEALRALRTQLMLRWFNSEHKVLAICSPSNGDGRSYLAANLAIVFSQLGNDVLLVDADMRQPRQHEIFNLSNRTGLSTVLAGRGDGGSIDRIAHFDNLSVITAGAVPPNPLELLSRPEFPRFLDPLTRRFEIVLLDTPASNSGADVQTIAMRAGGALILGRMGRTRLKDLQALSAGITSSGAVIVGSLFNRY